MANTPLRGRYLVRNPLWNWWLRVSDWVLGFWVSAQGSRLRDMSFGLWALGSRRSSHPKPRAQSPKLHAGSRVLVAISGHIGDAVIATSVLRELARRSPGVEIGVLCASWNRVVFEEHPLVTRIHTVDHWRLNRGGGSLIGRWRRWQRTRAQAAAEIRAAGYDAAIDLASHYPNSAHVLAAARVSVRIGYESGGGGPLYTTALAWEPRGHVTGEHMRLLDVLTAQGSRRSAEPTYELPGIPSGIAAKVREKFGGLRGSYVVLHPGAGNERKEWPLEKWVELTRELAMSGSSVVVTGTGGAQARLARVLADAVPGVVSLVDQLTWEEFRAVIASARAVVSVDTVAMHLAAASATPCVALMTGMDRTDRWRPLGTTTTVLSHPVDCSPCYLSRGCDAMSCIRQIEGRSVKAALESAMAPEVRPTSL